MKTHPLVRRVIVFVCVLPCVYMLTFCTAGSSSTSFIDRLNNVDSVTAVHDYEAAWSMLKKAEKYARSPYERLAIVRRALILDRSSFAQKVLQKALRHFPDNQELLAVYTHFLVSSGKSEEALRYGAKLEGGPYGSLYAELLFRFAAPVNFFSSAYKQAFADAARTTGNAVYFRNAALIEAFFGNMEASFSFHPASLSAYDSEDTARFWARISYDSGNFIQCTQDLQFVQDSAQKQSLLAEAYLRSGDEKKAVAAWLDSTERFADENPSAWCNAAKAAFKAGSIGYAYLFLEKLTERFPDYIPGLAAYAAFSVGTFPHTAQNVFSDILKQRGIKTLSMELDDVVPRVKPEEALKRIEKAMGGAQNDTVLLLEYTKLKWAAEQKNAAQNQAQNTEFFKRKRQADLWRLLEQTTAAGGRYDPRAVHFVLYYLCADGMFLQADELLARWNTLRSSAAVPQAPELWEYDIGAYIDIKRQRYEQAERMLEVSVYTDTDKNVVSAGTGALALALLKGRDPAAVFNLALLYNASGKRVQAIVLYKKLLSAVTDTVLQAEIYYRIALIQLEQREKRSAVLSLNQCIALNSAHAQARLLLKTINDGQN